MKRNLLTLDFAGLSKVISGGQCGVDRGGLDAARLKGIETGGTAPKGWRTWYGPDESLRDLGLVEHFSPAYPPRTEKNVCDADATLILGSNLSSGGTALTINLCRKHKKPVFIVRLPVKDLSKAGRDIAAFIEENAAVVLNVAGNRDTGTGVQGTFHYDQTVEVLREAFTVLDVKDLLNRS